MMRPVEFEVNASEVKWNFIYTQKYTFSLSITSTALRTQCMKSKESPRFYFLAKHKTLCLLIKHFVCIQHTYTVCVRSFGWRRNL
jgi:hypothetical protein